MGNSGIVSHENGTTETMSNMFGRKFEEYVSPCMCAGSIGHVHTACIKEYICSQLAQFDLKKPPTFGELPVKCAIARFSFNMRSRLQLDAAANDPLEELLLGCSC